MELLSLASFETDVFSIGDVCVVGAMAIGAVPVSAPFTATNVCSIFPETAVADAMTTGAIFDIAGGVPVFDGDFTGVAAIGAVAAGVPKSSTT